MEQYFDKEILQLEKELSQLKTSAQRSSGVVETISKTVAVSIPLRLSSNGMSCSGTTRYIIKTESNSIIITTLDWYYGSIEDAWKTGATRTIKINEMNFTDGRRGLEMVATGTSISSNQSDDVSKLKNGQSVNVAANLTVIATDNFTIEAA